MVKSWAWMTGTLAGTIDTKSFKLDVTEYDWSKVHNVIYNENGATIRTIPAIHFEQFASFIFEWNGLKVAFVGDSLPNKWWIDGWPEAVTPLAEEIYSDFNKEHGTDYKFQLKQ
jgi:ribonuclease Z